MARSWPVPESCEAEGMEAMFDLQRLEEKERADPNFDRYAAMPSGSMSLYQKAAYLQQEGQMGHSTFCAGTVFSRDAVENESSPETGLEAGKQTKD